MVDLPQQTEAHQQGAAAPKNVTQRQAALLAKTLNLLQKFWSIPKEMS